MEYVIWYESFGEKQAMRFNTLSDAQQWWDKLKAKGYRVLSSRPSNESGN